MNAKSGTNQTPGPDFVAFYTNIDAKYRITSIRL